ncbi:DUF3365 domain-containing protein [Blastopirellula sp. JC732]|uniref:DUF3365 domain-containing protein n=1 Tax=Blastopirellula sediminis TaxID=2894196 RepID=A0A9X1SI38_9BACT|nr:DUF3365 domain-containing protein [Blastopirellula sediminis]MCC9605562.1 DUF3365 domain-containing protein [Blastopirellula sediminis]MCC9631138.1 DUF3365 domain-containing protein [Blastopirellula sediminis]
MNRAPIVLALLLSIAGLAAATIADESSEQASPAPPVRIEEARSRARLLHETLHGTLQVMHRDFFDEEESHAIPSRSLEDVFAELERSHHVKIRWISVNTNAMNIDNEPKSPFEKLAAKELAEGKPEHDSVDNGRYQYAGAIRLASRCLKCHVPNRKSTESRIAGLVISMPIAEEK